MDPNAALASLRRLSTRVAEKSDDPYAADLAEKFSGLDQWLSRGGFPPAAWVAPKARKNPSRPAARPAARPTVRAAARKAPSARPRAAAVRVVISGSKRPRR